MSTSAKELLVSSARQFYDLGWMRGYGGALCYQEGGKFYSTPAKAQHDRLNAAQIVVGPTLTREANEEAPLFECIFRHFPKAVACIHAQSVNSVLASLLFRQTFQVSHLQPIARLRKRYDETLVVPILENAATVADLEAEMERVLLMYPDAPAVLVRRRGLYVWGNSWEEAKIKAENLDQLFELAGRMIQQKLNPSQAPKDDDWTSSSSASSSTSSLNAAARATK